MENGNGNNSVRGLPRSDSPESARPKGGRIDFRELVRASVKARQCGWYATRGRILNRGGSLKDVAKVLVWQLNILGVEEKERAGGRGRIPAICPELTFGESHHG